MINSTHYPLIFCAPLESHVSAPSFCSCYEPGLNQCANKLTLQVDQQQLLAPKGNNQLQLRVQMAALHELARRGFPRSSPPEFYRVSWHEAGNYLRYEIVYSNIQYLCALCHLLESKQKQKNREACVLRGISDNQRPINPSGIQVDRGNFSFAALGGYAEIGPSDLIITWLMRHVATKCGEPEIPDVIISRTQSGTRHQDR